MERHAPAKSVARTQANGAIERWIQSALAYVPAVARRFAHCGIPLDELLAAGNLGLVQAALRYDPSRNIRFITYADWWIRKAMLQAIQEQSGPVRLPRYRLDQLRRLRDARARMEQTLGAPPSAEALARTCKLPLREVEALLTLEGRGVSLDQPLGPDREAMSAFIADAPERSPQEHLVRSDFVRYLRALLSRLDARSVEVLTLRYGLDDAPPRTLREVGRCLGLSRERVRQIERRALHQLRDHLRQAGHL